MADVTDSPVVLDVSAALSFLFEDERDDLAILMARAVVERGARVPVLWRLELRNALLSAERRRRLRSDDVEAILADVRRLPIEVFDQHPGVGTGEPEVAAARKYNLSVYDASYLDLAATLQIPLMTRDAALGGAAEKLHLLWKAPAKKPHRTKSAL